MPYSPFYSAQKQDTAADRTKNLSAKYSLQALALTTVLLGSSVSTPAFSEGNDTALEVLRSIARTPSHARSLQVKSDALLITGSVVRSGGSNRVLYHLPSNGEGLRLHGETASLVRPVFFAKEQLAGDIMLRLAYRNAVSVMPEASNLAVEINGVVIGKRTIQSPDRSRTLE